MTHPYTRWLISGTAGSGKTTFAATFPGPILVFSFDPTGKEAPFLDLGVPGPIEFAGEAAIPYRDVTRPDGSLACRIEYYHDENPLQARAYQVFMARIDAFSVQEREPWGTVVFDSITSLELIARYEQMRLNPDTRDKRQHYAGSAEALEQLLYTRVGAYQNINVVVIAHTSEQRDESTGGFVRGIGAPGRLTWKLPTAFPELYRAYAVREGKNQHLSYALQTSPIPDYNAFSGICKAPSPCLPDYEALWVNHETHATDEPATVATNTGVNT